jgi:GrpB-like predicted nucleotidyltransferase (UPF0157 family)
MSKLHRMTPQELGALFPIELVPPSALWPSLFREEEDKIRMVLSHIPDLEADHIGSTAIPGMHAKPVIDILLRVPADADEPLILFQLRSIGYEYIYRPDNPPPHMMFAKGYSESGYTGQVFHIHIGHQQYTDEIIFRDYLLAHPETVAEYEALKKELSKKFRYDREAYTEGKTAFVHAVLTKAKN